MISSVFGDMNRFSKAEQEKSHGNLELDSGVCGFSRVKWKNHCIIKNSNVV